MAIDTESTKNKLFAGLQTNKEIPAVLVLSSIDQAAAVNQNISEKIESLSKPIAEGEKIPKWQSLDKVTALLTTEQKEGLDRVAKKLMKFRSKDLKTKDDRERITTNTIIRSLIENFLKKEEMLELKSLSSEEEVTHWIEGVFKK